MISSSYTCEITKKRNDEQPASPESKMSCWGSLTSCGAAGRRGILNEKNDTLFSISLTAPSSGDMMKKYVAWDREKRLSFAVPFVDMKPVIYLDTFLPRVTELALSASDRQTKVLLFFISLITWSLLFLRRTFFSNR